MADKGNDAQDRLALIVHILANCGQFEANCVETPRDSVMDVSGERASMHLANALANTLLQRLPVELSMIKSSREEGDYGPGAMRHSVEGYLISRSDMHQLTRAVKSLLNQLGYDPQKPGY